MSDGRPFDAPLGGPRDVPLDVLIPTYRRPGALAVTLAGLAAQTLPEFRVVVSDQDEADGVEASGEVRAVCRVLRAHGRPVEIHRHLPRRGMAEQREFLLDQTRAPYALFLDDDILLEPWVADRLLETIRAEGCGFVGSAPIGLSYIDDVRPHEQAIELWPGRVEPETVEPGGTAWARHRLHNAANVWHVARRLGARPEAPLRYRVAWVGGCVLYDVAALRASGGFSFWDRLPPEHAGEDVLAQLRVMARAGGCAILPSGAYHQELPTTIENRTVNAPLVARP